MDRRAFIAVLGTGLSPAFNRSTGAYLTLHQLGAHCDGVLDDLPAVLAALGPMAIGTKIIITRGIYRVGTGWVMQNCTKLATSIEELRSWAGLGQ
jgi:hypothetical protein